MIKGLSVGHEIAVWQLLTDKIISQQFDESFLDTGLFSKGLLLGENLLGGGRDGCLRSLLNTYWQGHRKNGHAVIQTRRNKVIATP